MHRSFLKYIAIASIVGAAVYIVVTDTPVPVITTRRALKQAEDAHAELLKAHHIEALKQAITSYPLKNTLAHLETDRIEVVANHNYSKANCVTNHFFRATDMCIDFDRAGYLVSYAET